MTIDARTARLVADRIGPDVSRLRSDRRAARALRSREQDDYRRDVKEIVGACDVARRLGRDAGDRARLGRRRASRAGV